MTNSLPYNSILLNILMLVTSYHNQVAAGNFDGL